MTVIRHNLPLDTEQPVIHYFEFHVDQPLETDYIAYPGDEYRDLPGLA